MEFFHAIILGIVEGVTEFLPISSTGHLVLVSEILRIPDSSFLKSFEITIQLGAILAVIVLYAKKLSRSFGLWKKIAIAFAPTAVVGVLLYQFLTGLLDNELVTVLAIGIGGVVLIVIELFYKEEASTAHELEQISYKQSLLVGLAQVVAFIPGVSRSAATIVGGMLAGISRRAIVEFSFLLAIPTMVAATGFDLVKNVETFSVSNWGLLLIGFSVSFIVAWLAIWWLLRFVQKHTFIPFGVYRIIIGIVFLVVIFV